MPSQQPKIFANQTVYWHDGSRAMTGRVKKILADHAEVLSEGCSYIVSMAALSKKPIKTASGGGRTIIKG